MWGVVCGGWGCRVCGRGWENECRTGYTLKVDGKAGDGTCVCACVGGCGCGWVWVCACGRLRHRLNDDSKFFDRTCVRVCVRTCVCTCV